MKSEIITALAIGVLFGLAVGFWIGYEQGQKEAVKHLKIEFPQLDRR